MIGQLVIFKGSMWNAVAIVIDERESGTFVYRTPRNEMGDSRHDISRCTQKYLVEI